jgi:hypothetical protein
MFIATAHSPDANINKDKAIEDFTGLIGRTCEYLKILEDLGKLKKGSYMPLFDAVHTASKKTLEQNWNDA